MKHSDQGITRTERGEEQPSDKDRAQTAQKTGNADTAGSSGKERERGRKTAARSGHSTEND